MPNFLIQIIQQTLPYSDFPQGCLQMLPRWCLHLIVVRGFEYVSDPESYTSGSVATGRVFLAGQVKGQASDKERYQN